jgi:hypothetical protein
LIQGGRFLCQKDLIPEKEMIREKLPMYIKEAADWAAGRPETAIMAEETVTVHFPET